MNIEKNEIIIIYINKGLLIKNISLLILIILLNIMINNSKNKILKSEMDLYKKYIITCTRFKKYNNKKRINNKNPYLSIILPIYNMEKYIERALLSILNQSFQDFEIIIVNDFSNDNTEQIIQKYKKIESKVKVIEHNQNFGTYLSRVDGALDSKGQYIIFIDPDDILLNPCLFKKIYEFNSKYYLDIIEFIVFFEDEGNNKIIIPDNHRLNHFHNFKQKIIYQTKLSNLLFFEPGNENISGIICRPIWNKVIKKSILLKTINFIGKDIYTKKYFNFAEDTIMNIINFQFANNYSNVNIPGYLYNIRKKSISHNYASNYNILISKNFLLYFKLLYKYIKYFKKHANILYNELKDLNYFLLKFKKFNETQYIVNTKQYLNNLLNEKNISIQFKELLKNLYLYFY